jgi:hypothetical protein
LGRYSGKPLGKVLWKPTLETHSGNPLWKPTWEGTSAFKHGGGSALCAPTQHCCLLSLACAVRAHQRHNDRSAEVLNCCNCSARFALPLNARVSQVSPEGDPRPAAHEPPHTPHIGARGPWPHRTTISQGPDTSGFITVDLTSATPAPLGRPPSSHHEPPHTPHM